MNNTGHFFKIVLLLFLCAGLFGCQFDPYTYSYTSTEPKNEDLVGIYRLDEPSKKMVLETGKYPLEEARIQLDSNGRFVMSNVPDWWRTNFGIPGGTLDSGEGQWQISKHRDWWAILMKFDSHQVQPSFADSRAYITDFMLVGERPPYKIHLTIGDPDGGDAMQFEKSSQ